MSKRKVSEDGAPRLETRARRRLELIALRNENEKLKEDRAQFLEKIRELEHAVTSNGGNTVEECRVKSENELLRTELDFHKKLMAKFASLLRATPEHMNAEHKLLKEGADSAHALVLGLFSQSQTSWTPLKPPPRLTLEVQKCELCYKFDDDLFGTKMGTEKIGTDERFNVRADCILPNVQLEDVSATLWDWFCQHQTMSPVYHLDESQLELKAIKGTQQDEDIKVVRFQRQFEKKEYNEDVVFICNRRKQTLAKSTLAMPNRSNEEFGKVKAQVISAMTTSIYCDIPRNQDLDQSIMKVLKGGIIWQEGDDVKMCVVYSEPREFSTVKHKLCGQILTEKGRMTKTMATALQMTTNMFYQLVRKLQDGK